MIILVSGKQGSGKTTLCENLRTYYSGKNFNTYRFRFAQPLYDIHDLIWNYMQQYHSRPKVKDGRLLQLLGTEWGRETLDKDIWVKIIKDEISSLPKSPEPFITIEDCRFLNEFNAFPEAIRIRLNCAHEIRKKRCSNWRDDVNHPSEISLDHEEFDLRLPTHVWSKEETFEMTIEFINDQIEKRKRNDTPRVNPIN